MGKFLDSPDYLSVASNLENTLDIKLFLDFILRVRTTFHLDSIVSLSMAFHLAAL